MSTELVPPKLEHSLARLTSGAWRVTGFYGQMMQATHDGYRLWVDVQAFNSVPDDALDIMDNCYTQWVERERREARALRDDA